MKVLVACEFSGIVRDAFIKRGHDAVSCDLLPTERPGPHIQGDVVEILDDGWDLMIAHPPCERVCVSGARWKYEKAGWAQEQTESLEFIAKLLNAPIPRIALENPIGIISTKIRPPTQVIQPWMFGVEETKATCLWLKRLPKLRPTKIMEKRVPRTHREQPSPERKRNRSWRFPLIAAAMAEQWDAGKLKIYDLNNMTLFELFEKVKANGNN